MYVISYAVHIYIVLLECIIICKIILAKLAHPSENSDVELELLLRRTKSFRSFEYSQYKILTCSKYSEQILLPDKLAL